MWKDVTESFSEKERHYKNTYLEIDEIFDDLEVSLFSSVDEPYEIYTHYGIMDGIIYTNQEHAYALREEVKQVLEKEYLKTKEPSSKFIDEFAKKYHLCLPNDLYFDTDALFEAMLKIKF